MTHQIRKNAPEGAELFMLDGDKVTYYMCDEDDNVFEWDGELWQFCIFMDRSYLAWHKDCHTIYTKHEALFVSALLAFGVILAVCVKYFG